MQTSIRYLRSRRYLTPKVFFVILSLGVLAGVMTIFGTQMTVATVLLVVVAAFPSLGFAIGVLADAVSLPVILVKSDTSQLVVASTVAIIAAIIVLYFRSRKMRSDLAIVALPLMFLLIFGTVVGLTNMDWQQVLIGARFFFLPIMVAIGAAIIRTKSIDHILILCGCVMVINVPILLWEVSLGTDGLLDLGLTYGQSVRTADSVLRPPGTFAANYVLGAFAAVYSSLQLALMATSRERRNLFGCLFLAAGITAMLLSTARFAIVIFVVTTVAIALTSRRRVSLLLRVLTVASGFAVVVALFVTGSTSNESIILRLELWQDRLETLNVWIGSGWGSSGASTLSGTSTGSVIVDNYYISLLFQLGLTGIFLAIATWVFVIRGLRNNAVNEVGNLTYAGRVVLVGVLVSFLFTETWEYSGAMCLLMLCLFSKDKPAIRN